MACVLDRMAAGPENRPSGRRQVSFRGVAAAANEEQDVVLDRSDGQTRRDVLRLGAAGAAGLLTGGLRGLAAEAVAVAAPPPRKKRIPVGLQLYSVRNECGKDKGKNLTKVIEAVAKMGYEAVEFAGYYGWGAKDLKKLLDANGLTCCGTHTGLGALQGDNFQRTVDLHKTLGAKFIIVPGMPRQYTRTAEGWKKAAGVFNEIAAKLEPLGMYTGYHNHSHEFHKMGDTTPWDIFFGNTHERVVMQLDTGNCMGGKGDPVAIMKKYPGRQLTLHMKEHGGTPKTVVGEGTCPWKELIRLARTIGKTRWFVIEHERRGQSPLEAVAKCITNFRKIQAEV